jgi:hypothetical protein
MCAKAFPGSPTTLSARACMPAGGRLARANSRQTWFAYLLFTGSRLVLDWAVLAPAGSPASVEEGFGPAGAIFAAGVLAFAAAVPAVAFSPLGVPEPAAPPPAASSDETGAAARARVKAKAHVLFNIMFLLALRTGATTSLSTHGARGW